MFESSAYFFLQPSDICVQFPATKSFNLYFFCHLVGHLWKHHVRHFDKERANKFHRYSLISLLFLYYYIACVGMFVSGCDRSINNKYQMAAGLRGEIRRWHNATPSDWIFCIINSSFILNVGTSQLKMYFKKSVPFFCVPKLNRIFCWRKKLLSISWAVITLVCSFASKSTNLFFRTFDAFLLTPLASPV